MTVSRLQFVVTFGVTMIVRDPKRRNSSTLLAEMKEVDVSSPKSIRRVALEKVGDIWKREIGMLTSFAFSRTRGGNGLVSGWVCREG